MSAIGEVAKFAAADVRYGVTIITALVLSVFVLLFKDLTDFMQHVFVPALAVYTVGSAVIGHFQILVTFSTNTKAAAGGDRPRGIKESHLLAILIAHALWFIAFGVFVGVRACADCRFRSTPCASIVLTRFAFFNCSNEYAEVAGCIDRYSNRREV